MAVPGHNHNAVPQDTLITIKVSVNDSLKKLKLPLRDLGANVLPDKLRQLLAIKPEQTVVFERFSDSAGGYITLDVNNPQVFKTLVRAAKAKLKLRLKATVTPVEKEVENTSETVEAEQHPAPPLIVRTPIYQNNPRDSMAFDRRSVGSGIFQFREARASQQTLINTDSLDEAPVPRPFATNNSNFFEELASLGSHVDLALRHREQPIATIVSTSPWSVYCNECDKPMVDAHFHCSICDGGDFDLCEECVTSGKLCPGEDHWLIKRSIKDGKVITSTTERISPRSASKSFKIKDLLQLQDPPMLAEAEETAKEMPGAFADDTKTLSEETRVATRTCNSCVVVLPEREFVTCIACDDFDLCITCHTANKHGHHPAHGFKPATEDTVLPLAATTMLAPGRNVRHNAICDGCDKSIYGIRHKCLNCPDWDFCNDCVKDARHTHPRHRFAAVFEPISQQPLSSVRHFGIYCDGPLCNKSGQSYITGVRYKCAVCHDTDFCGACEALPGNHHNRTHPLVKFKTPVRNVNIATENEDLRGNVRMMGDLRTEAEKKSVATETTPVQQTNAATQVQTMAEIEPTFAKPATLPIPVFRSVEQDLALRDERPVVKLSPAVHLDAHFVKDSVPDGMVVAPGARFTQIWTMRNPGPFAWPAGCSVRYVGGDNMLNVDNGHPASVTDIADATESNVVGREVLVNEEVAFKVVLKAPLREGKGISYWRLKAADGAPFGHRLWCDINIRTSVAPQLEAFKPTLKTGAMSQLDAAQRASYMRMDALRQQQRAMLQASQAQQQATMVAAQQAAQAQQMYQKLHSAPLQPTCIYKPLPETAASEMDKVTAAARLNVLTREAPLPQQETPLNPPNFQMSAQTLRQQLEMMAMQQKKTQQEKSFTSLTGAPPAYDSTENLTSRLASMRAEQQKRRDQMMAQFTAQRELPGASFNQMVSSPPVMALPTAQSPMVARNSYSLSEEDKARKEAAKQRVEHIKAKIMRTREERARAVEAQKAAAVVSAEQKSAEETEKVEKVKKLIEEVSKVDATPEVVVKAEEDMERSQMVFPTLEKESPASSTYQSASSLKAKVAYVEDEEGVVLGTASPVTAVVAAPATSPAPVASPTEERFEDSIEDDFEVMTADGEIESEDDGFLTDEEYDILDASDNETVASK